jgi:hypothetical protein
MVCCCAEDRVRGAASNLVGSAASGEVDPQNMRVARCLGDLWSFAVACFPVLAAEILR